MAVLPPWQVRAMSRAGSDMRWKPIPFIAVILAIAAPIAAQVQQAVEPAVQPGGDIPRDFRAPLRPRALALPAPPRPGSDLQYLRREAMIPMRDGARLYTVLIVPRGARKAPILLDRTPYSAARAAARGAGPWPENILSPLFAELIRAGYIVALQDVRGKYRSEGDYVMNRPLRGPLNPTDVDHSTDAYDTIDWLVRNVREGNGRVGVIGTSYDGFTAAMALVNPHPALKAAVPINPMVDVWKGDDWFHNGAFRQSMVSYVYGQTAARDSDQESFPGGTDDYNAFLRYGSAAEYGRALGMERMPFWRRLLRHPDYDAYWRQQAVDRILARTGLTVPTLIVGSLWDQEDIYGAAALFQAMKGSGKARFALGPWYHGQVNYPGVSLGQLDWGTDTARWFRLNVMIPFLDAELKGGPAANVARVTAFEVGPNQWRRLDDWPPACLRGCGRSLTALHLSDRSRLAFDEPGANGSDTYVSDPARPVPYRPQPSLSPWAKGSTWPYWLVDSQRYLEGRSDVLTYSSAPLTAPLKLAGTPLVHLVASTTGTDSDWVVKLIDVYPDAYPAKPLLGGYRLPIAMEVMRGRYRDDPSKPKAVPANQPVTYEFALPAISYTVQPGHRLMVQVQSSWFPLYDRNPQTFVPNIFFAKASDYRTATQRIFYGPSGTWIGLPVVK
ncbi:CocE/NonD family hydrolase [Sphingomonas hankyongi]|uniref:CocE/NonD family hydrolase n=1 Tax=Sphingomonas hankyongi TaxID=2908209 RepID=A0ABT0S0F5_9SPHN|nr:CocE/NonD family hydrolase [Sphingomonas hankyongi]MCL6729111.1 CocE/NonD family hydrolase [Sphingomonas hankyongi]